MRALSLWHGVMYFAEPGYAPRRIVQEVAAQHDLTPEDLTGPRSRRTESRARHEAMWRIRRETRLSYPQIGRFFNRDHTTVINGVRRHEQRALS